MSCFYPLPAYLDGGVVKVRKRELGDVRESLELPCGYCVGCKLDRARAWSIRIMHEASLHDSNLFCTFDYAPEHLRSWSLEYEDFQSFMKRLRRNLGAGIRFFVAGEYGEKYERPHWHAVLFNCWFPDSVKFCNETYRSRVAELLWGKGNVVIGAVTPASAAYCAGYSLYKVRSRYVDDLVDPVTGEVSSRRRPFVQMSRRKGIGAGWYERYKGDLFPADHAVVEGKEFKVPKYYWDKFRETADAVVVEDLVARRVERARAVPVEESTERRRMVRAGVAEARVKFFERSH